MRYPSHPTHELYAHVLSALPDAPVVPDRPRRSTSLWRVVHALRRGARKLARPTGRSAARARPSLQ